MAVGDPTTFDALSAFNALLQRKALSGMVLVAPASSAFPAALTTSAGALAVLPAGYQTIGKITSDGISLSDSVTKQEDRGWGDVYPSRIDVESESASMSFTGMEMNKRTLENFWGIDLTAVQAAASSKEIVFSKPKLPTVVNKRVIAIMRDVNKDGSGEIYVGLGFPAAQVGPNGDVSFAFTSPGMGWPLQAQATHDDASGTPLRIYLGGPGLASLVTAMGFTVGS